MPQRRPARRSGYIYILYSAGWYKIGLTSGDIPKRVSSLQTGNPFPITVYHYFVSANMEFDEGVLHEMYAQYRGLGEWFQLPDDEVRWLKSIHNLQQSIYQRKQGSWWQRAISKIL